MLIQADRLTRVIVRLLEAAGAETERAQVCADHLVTANLKGHDSHGVGMAPSYVRWIADGKLHPNARPEVIRDKGAVIVVDGRFGLGQPVAREAVELGIARARTLGVACVGLRNACHIGRIGAYGEQAAAAGLVSTHYVNVVGAGPAVAPFGGREARMLTNPYCCAIPRPSGEPVVLDFATSAIAIGKLRVAHMKGLPAPEGVLVDSDGRPTTDTHTFYTSNPERSFLLPFGLHKGGGLQVICELLGGALAGEWTMQPGSDREYGAAVNNMLSIYIDPDAFGGRNAFEAEAEAMLDYIRSTQPGQGVDRVRLPGDPERETMAARLAQGVPIDDRTWGDLVRAAEIVGLSATEIDSIA